MRLVGVVLLFSSLAIAQRDVFHAQNVTVTGSGGAFSVEKSGNVRDVTDNQTLTWSAGGSDTSGNKVAVAFIDDHGIYSYGVSGGCSSPTTAVNKSHYGSYYVTVVLCTSTGGTGLGLTSTGSFYHYSAVALSMKNAGTFTFDSTVGLVANNGTGSGSGIAWATNSTGTLSQSSSIVIPVFFNSSNTDMAALTETAGDSGSAPALGFWGATAWARVVSGTSGVAVSGTYDSTDGAWYSYIFAVAK